MDLSTALMGTQYTGDLRLPADDPPEPVQTVALIEPGAVKEPQPPAPLTTTFNRQCDQHE
jgi:hypothetical protein